MAKRKKQPAPEVVFIEHLRKRMDEKGISANEIHRRTDGQIAVTTIGRIRNGDTPQFSLKNAGRIAEALGVPIEEMVV